MLDAQICFNTYTYTYREIVLSPLKYISSQKCVYMHVNFASFFTESIVHVIFKRQRRFSFYSISFPIQGNARCILRCHQPKEICANLHLYWIFHVEYLTGEKSPWKSGLFSLACIKIFIRNTMNTLSAWHIPDVYLLQCIFDVKVIEGFIYIGMFIIVLIYV